MQSTAKVAPPSGMIAPHSPPPYRPEDFERDPPILGKRRASDLSTTQTNAAIFRERVEQRRAGANVPPSGTNSDDADVTGRGHGVTSEWERGVEEAMDRLEELEEGPWSAGPPTTLGAGGSNTATTSAPELLTRPVDPVSDLRLDAEGKIDQALIDTADDLDLAELRRVIEGEDGEELDQDMFDFDALDEEDMMDLDAMDDEEEDYDEYNDDFDDEDEDEDDGFGDSPEDPSSLSARALPSEFAGVDLLLPRRSFKGARNMETVKDCALTNRAS